MYNQFPNKIGNCQALCGGALSYIFTIKYKVTVYLYIFFNINTEIGWLVSVSVLLRRGCTIGNSVLLHKRPSKPWCVRVCNFHFLYILNCNFQKTGEKVAFFDVSVYADFGFKLDYETLWSIHRYEN